MDCEKYPMLGEVTLADPLTDRAEFVQIDVLVGLDYYYDFVMPDRIQCPNGPLLLSSRLGYIATGRISTPITGPETIAVMLLSSGQLQTPYHDSKFVIERYWDLEDIGMKEHPRELSGDDEALKEHSATLEQSDDGRYVSKWPWKCKNPDLPDNFELAYGRLKSLLKKFTRNREVFGAYQQVIADQLQNGVIETVPAEPTGPSVYYMPHHCVITPTKSTTKIRVVYDASSKSRSDVPSLNDCLHRGPVMLEDLCGLLMRFRIHRVALVSDIEKAFLQIGLNVEDRDVTRFLWVENPLLPPVDSNLKIFRFCRIPFGIISSPFVLENTMCQHLVKTGTEVALKILKDHYVDNVITGETTDANAIRHYHEAKMIFMSARMNLREWYSNSQEVRNSFSDSDKGRDDEPKILGLRWNCEDDTLRCEKLKDVVALKTTKRQILKIVSQIFDPLGFFAPVTVLGKMLIQELWKGGYSWDDSLPLDAEKRWKKIQNSLREISDVSVPRLVWSCNAKQFDLHAFCDASVKACAVVVYLTVSESTIRSEILMAKTRLAPTKANQTIPRLELVAVVIGVRLLSFVEKQLLHSPSRKFLWTDSQCTLHWIQRAKVSTKFVENRLEEIRKHTDVSFRFVPSEQNPADLPSRGCETSALRNCRLWWNGPTWLREDEKKWPKFEIQDGYSNEEIHALAIPADTELRYPVLDETRFSSYSRLLRSTAYVQRFISNLRKPEGSRYRGPISSEELQKAEKHWLGNIQWRFFPELVSHQGAVWPKGLGIQLHLFKDCDGILRCSGRVDRANLPYDAKYPILLPKAGHFVELLIAKCHQTQLHSGASQTLAQLRKKYWIIRGRNAVRKVIRNCKVCVRVEGGPYRMPPVPILPKERLSEDPPFTYTGLDYLGPLFVKNADGAKRKTWICLYTCMSVRAVYLDVVEDLSSDQFLLSLRRFAATNGSPRVILSDNAPQFHASDNALQKWWNELISSRTVQNYVANQGIKWEFIVEFSPWMGGFYERLVGIAKRALKKTLGSILATPSELATVVAEITAVINSRPLVYLENEIGTLPLAPAHFLRANVRPGFPCFPLSVEEYSPRSRPSRSDDLASKWKRLQSISQNFWEIWRHHYLLSLRERAVAHKQRNCASLEPKCDAVVHIKDNLPRSCWKLGRISELHRSRDGRVRSATVTLSTGKRIKRPVKLLFPIEMEQSGDEVRSVTGHTISPKQHNPSPVLRSLPKRRAAHTASLRWRQQLELESNDED